MSISQNRSSQHVINFFSHLVSLCNLKLSIHRIALCLCGCFYILSSFTNMYSMLEIIRLPSFIQECMICMGEEINKISNRSTQHIVLFTFMVNTGIMLVSSVKSSLHLISQSISSLVATQILSHEVLSLSYSKAGCSLPKRFEQTSQQL